MPNKTWYNGLSTRTQNALMNAGISSKLNLKLFVIGNGERWFDLIDGLGKKGAEECELILGNVPINKNELIEYVKNLSSHVRVLLGVIKDLKGSRNDLTASLTDSRNIKIAAERDSVVIELRRVIGRMYEARNRSFKYKTNKHAHRDCSGVKLFRVIMQSDSIDGVCQEFSIPVAELSQSSAIESVKYISDWSRFCNTNVIKNTSSFKAIRADEITEPADSLFGGDVECFGMSGVCVAEAFYGCPDRPSGEAAGNEAEWDKYLRNVDELVARFNEIRKMATIGM